MDYPHRTSVEGEAILGIVCRAVAEAHMPSAQHINNRVEISIACLDIGMCLCDGSPQSNLMQLSQQPGSQMVELVCDGKGRLDELRLHLRHKVSWRLRKADSPKP